MIAGRHCPFVRVLAIVLLALGATGVASVPASAKVVHHIEGSFDGAEAPHGSLGADLLSDAGDNSSGPSSGDVYVLEGVNKGLGEGVVDKFGADGGYAGVQITGAETAFGSFEFGSFQSGVAVDSSLSFNSGDVYVSDSGHHVVDKFDEDGKFICEIAGAATETKALKLAPSIAECDAAGSGLSGAMEPAGLAVDDSGDVYVANNEKSVIEEFGPEGHLMRTLKSKEHLSSAMASIALDSSGDLYVTNFESTVVELNAEGKFEREIASKSYGVAVDRASSPNDVYVDNSNKEDKEILEYEPSGVLRGRVPASMVFPGLAVNDATGKLYAAAASFGTASSAGVEIIGPDVVVPGVASEPASGVTQTSATLHGRVEPDLVHGGGDITSCRFEYVTEKWFQEHGYEGAATTGCEAVKPLPYAEAESVTAGVSLASSTTYHYRVVAGDVASLSEVNDGEGEAKPEATVTTPGAPGVVAESEEATTRSATLTAQIDPFGFASTCEAQIVAEAEFEASGYARAMTVTCPHALEAGFSAQNASVVVTGLSVGTTYHYRFVAGNGAGSTTGADETFATFGLQSFTFETLDAEGHPYTQAGGHPYVLRTSFALNTNGREAQANVKDTETQLPAGLIGNPTAVTRCTREQLTYFECPGAAQVGVLTLRLSHGAPFAQEPIYNLVPPAGVPAEFGTRFNSFTNLYIDSNVRTGGDYGVTARVSNASAATGVVGATVELWGVPAATSHDAQRKCPPLPGEEKERGPCSAGVAPVSFLREPTSCGGELSASMSVDAWQDPGAFVSRTAAMPAITGCERLDFTPSLSLVPSTSEADSPSGLALDLKQPQSQAPEGLGGSDLESSSVALPAGVSVNPSAAAGLQACSPAQIGLEEESEPSCPEASKIGTVEIETPLLPDVVEGSVYVAEQDNNPFGSLLAIYVVAQADGALVKLAGHVEANQETGQLTTSFEDLPQLPFSDLRLHLFGGPRGALATPEGCGTFASSSSWGPWSAISLVSLWNPFSISTGCVLAFAPSFSAGSMSVQAGAFSPLLLSFSRSDSEQEPTGLTVTLPPGLVAKLAGVPLCPDAEASAGDCPESSQIGTVLAVAGAGPNPISLPGRIYLTGPYKGAPYGESVVVPAVAGPYNLGDVVVRGAIRINPVTAQATVESDPFPTIRQGIPVRLRAVQATIDRPEFTLNPTSCARMAVNATVVSSHGASASESSPFQVANCATLPFHPTLEASTQGQASKADGASLTVKVTSQGLGVANIAKTKLTLPLALPSRLSTIQKACVDSVFESTPADPGSACDEGSQIGEGIARTPILNSPLQGPAYLVSHGGAAFPDVEFVLKGEGILLVLDGLTDIKNGITTSEFNTVPDAPVESFEAILPVGPHSAFAAYASASSPYELCGANLAMPTIITAQNGAVIEQDTNITATGCSGVKSSKTVKLTLAQQLAKALAKCRSTYKHSASKRAACERKAHATYTAMALAECRKTDKHSTKTRSACETEARKRYDATTSRRKT